MKMSILDIVQSTLSDMNSDQVNSIFDTVESEQIANIVKDTYYDLIVNKSYIDLRNFFKLNSSGSSSLPNVMVLPTNVAYVEAIYYLDDKLEQLSREQFIELVRHNPKNDATQEVIIPNVDISLNIVNNYKPKYWTSFDDKTIIFDSFDKEKGSLILTADVMGYGEITPVWSMVDNFIPQLPLRAYPLLLAEVKSKSFADIKQMPSGKEEQRATNLRRRISRTGNKTHNGIRYPDYGRK